MEVFLGVKKKRFFKNIKFFKNVRNYLIKFTTRSNITTTLIIPNLLSYKWNMIVENINCEVALLTSKYRQEILKQNIYEITPGDSIEDLIFKAPFTVYVTIHGESNVLIRNTFSKLVQKLDNKATLLIAREDFLGNTRFKEGQNMVFTTKDKLAESENTLYIDWTKEKPILEGAEIDKVLYFKDKKMRKKANIE